MALALSLNPAASASAQRRNVRIKRKGRSRALQGCEKRNGFGSLRRGGEDGLLVGLHYGEPMVEILRMVSGALATISLWREPAACDVFCRGRFSRISRLTLRKVGRVTLTEAV